jgi:hypothetical protein
MVKRWSSTLLLSLVAVTAIQQAADAGPFRRRAERKQAEIEANVGRRLESKLDQDIDREMGIVSEKLAESNQSQFDGLKTQQSAEFQAQSNQLNATGQELKAAGAQLKAELLADFAKLRAESQALVAVQGKKLEEQTTQHIKAMQLAAEKKITDESKRLGDLVTSSMRTMKTASADELAKALEILRKQSDVQSKKLDVQLAKIPEIVDLRVDSMRTDLMPQISAAIKQQVNDSMPKPADKPATPETPEEAIVEPPVTTEENDEENDEDDADDDADDSDAEENEHDDS